MEKPNMVYAQFFVQVKLEKHDYFINFRNLFILIIKK